MSEIWDKRDTVLVHETEPCNAEPAPAALGGQITPLDTFYGRNHAPIPRIDAADWRPPTPGSPRR